MSSYVSSTMLKMTTYGAARPFKLPLRERCCRERARICVEMCSKHFGLLPIRLLELLETCIGGEDDCEDGEDHVHGGRRGGGTSAWDRSGTRGDVRCLGRAL